MGRFRQQLQKWHPKNSCRGSLPGMPTLLRSFNQLPTPKGRNIGSQTLIKDFIVNVQIAHRSSEQENPFQMCVFRISAMIAPGKQCLSLDQFVTAAPQETKLPLVIRLNQSFLPKGQQRAENKGVTDLNWVKYMPAVHAGNKFIGN
ncbi:uncharacterized protein PADG_11927 [Paracoccidioides brasiliensis Pb18]|uniref:Uncharacterized protein n=1 Tax=Paracoccidioides brasiliensis (strain Pb18) TaxID=502780 RepID=A0A0A0HTG1_PARBD|nr:uncharacterized protein PADG_11927 [Paracoccidioides brasiliensis Pb18]KGM91952.1 hypothetical protein PADG_11927 [Paracoccidioides brasiliensis Pb18]